MDDTVATYLLRVTIRHPKDGGALPDLPANRVAKIVDDRVTAEVEEYPLATVHVTAERTDR